MHLSDFAQNRLFVCTSRSIPGADGFGLHASSIMLESGSDHTFKGQGNTRPVWRFLADCKDKGSGGNG